MRIISLSVDGIHQAAQRGLYDWLAEQDADIICLQDLRALEYELDGDPFQLDGYFAYFFDSGERHYNGVAIYTRKQPKALIFGLGFSSGVDMEGRYLQADFEQISIGSLLAPSATSETESQEVKIKFFEDFQAHLTKITRKRREFIFCGNWAMAHKRIDVQNWQNNDSNSGFLPHEQQWMNQLFTQVGYADAFRISNTDTDEFTWWPSGEVGEGDGWRTDYQVISESLAGRVEYATTYKTKHFSSHLPLIIDYDLEV
ncbi:MAG: exodeoxyribonuclease III [Gammaproteobacteria bacterium]|uniref:exodeoxyribonuclease III n=1 Tax=Pseudomaricurvus alcaniphilus TaxID=1166482 RepID=UPI001407822C|nr:exodeoxyribonuclease III [Pseudomaricurvus alcaniphilus]MBR9909465.1 exodeoxyribonuclease III [Gammaproteobacteria bacterium]NHN37130.1 exodeoxyribonuclease III [Pseudomaricurvus alcaniphilus]